MRIKRSVAIGAMVDELMGLRHFPSGMAGLKLNLQSAAVRSTGGAGVDLKSMEALDRLANRVALIGKTLELAGVSPKMGELDNADASKFLGWAFPRSSFDAKVIVTPFCVHIDFPSRENAGKAGLDIPLHGGYIGISKSRLAKVARDYGGVFSVGLPNENARGDVAINPRSLTGYPLFSDLVLVHEAFHGAHHVIDPSHRQHPASAGNYVRHTAACEAAANFFEGSDSVNARFYTDTAKALLHADGAREPLSWLIRYARQKRAGEDGHLRRRMELIPGYLFQPHQTLRPAGVLFQPHLEPRYQRLKKSTIGKVIGSTGPSRHSLISQTVFNAQRIRGLQLEAIRREGKPAFEAGAKALALASKCMGKGLVSRSAAAVHIALNGLPAACSDFSDMLARAST